MQRSYIPIVLFLFKKYQRPGILLRIENGDIRRLDEIFEVLAVHRFLVARFMPSSNEYKDFGDLTHDEQVYLFSSQKDTMKNW